MRASAWIVAAACFLVGCAEPVVFSGSVAPIVAQARPSPPAVPATQPEAVIRVGADLSQGKFASEERTSFVARVRVRPQELTELPKPPISVALVLDTSASMAGSPLAEAKAAGLEFIDALGDDDQVSIVVFHSSAEVLTPMANLRDGRRAAARESIESLQAVGTTDLSGGLSAGFAQLRQGLAGGGAARVVLLSDGQPNDEAPIMPLVQQAASQGITVTALGLGLEYDEALLGKIAQTTGGRFHFAESPEKVAQLFREEVLALQRIVGRQAQLMLRPGPGVTVEGVLGPSSPGPAGFTLVQLGDLVERRDRDVFVLLSTEGHRAGATIEVLDAQLDFFDPIAKKARTQRAFASGQSVDDDDAIDASLAEGVAGAAAHARVADDTLAAMDLARRGALEEAKRRVSDAITRTRADAERFDDASLRAKVEELRALKGTLASLVPPKAPKMAKSKRGVDAPRSMPRPSPVGGAAAKASHAAAMAGLGY